MPGWYALLIGHCFHHMLAPFYLRLFSYLNSFMYCILHVSDGVPCLLLERRSAAHRAHADEVCFPGGMVCQINDRNIVATCLREMEEEIGGLNYDNIQVLGVFRCNWGEVHHLVGVAVTPVVCFLGEIPERLRPCPREVSEVFTVPLSSLSKKHLWVHKEGMAPIFLGAPHVIWGLTGTFQKTRHPTSSPKMFCAVCVCLYRFPLPCWLQSGNL